MLEKYKTPESYTMCRLSEVEKENVALVKNCEGLHDILDEKNVEIRHLSETIMQMRNFMHEVLEAEWCETASGEKWINVSGAWRENTANFVALFGEPREEE